MVWVVGDAYWTYAVCIAAITWFSIVTSAVEAHSNMKRLAGIAYFETEVCVCVCVIVCVCMLVCSFLCLYLCVCFCVCVDVS